MLADRFLAQINRAEQRYQEHTDARRARSQELEKLLAGEHDVTLNKIDTPSRMARRFVELSKDPLASEAILSRAFVPQKPSRADQNLNVLERIIKQNDLISADFLAAGMRASRTVGRVVLRTSSGIALGFGTCFLVSPRLAMTNNHVLSSELDAQNSSVQFDFVETLLGTQLPPVEFRFEPGVFFETDVELDFTLVAIEEENAAGIPLNMRGWTPLIEETGKAIVGERVNILQHPNGERQQLALRQNQIVDVPGNFLHYISDTDRGSSGSPVLNDQWQLAALHHAGVPKRENGNIMLISGVPWDGDRSTISQIEWIANEGTRISSIVKELRAREAGFSAEEAELFDQAFSSPEVEVSEAHSSDRIKPRYHNGQLSWTMPIEFSINVPALEPAVKEDHARKQRPSRPSNKLNQQGLDEFSQANLDRARAAFALHEQEEYYDSDSDETANIEYYSGIEDELTGEALFDALHELLKVTHTKEFTYTEARYDHLYPWIDLRENRSLASIYSGDPVDFETVIASEALIETRHAVEIQEFMLREGAFDERAINEFRFLLEAQDPFNCEHIVPQSWFDHDQPMRADLHHLITCEPGCNSSRGNNAYFEFDPDLTTFNQHCGQVNKSESKFEPVVGKGVVARATLYFLLRYPLQIGTSLNANRLPVLLKWHAKHPVTDYELHRNAEIQKVQGNRNPLIDFPLWAEAIPFESSLLKN